jgi:hypothetical protein
MMKLRNETTGARSLLASKPRDQIRSERSSRYGGISGGWGEAAPVSCPAFLMIAGGTGSDGAESNGSGASEANSEGKTWSLNAHPHSAWSPCDSWWSCPCATHSTTWQTQTPGGTSNRQPSRRNRISRPFGITSPPWLNDYYYRYASPPARQAKPGSSS